MTGSDYNPFSRGEIIVFRTHDVLPLGPWVPWEQKVPDGEMRVDRGDIALVLRIGVCSDNARWMNLLIKGKICHGTSDSLIRI